MNSSKLVNAVITFVTSDVRKTATYYHDVLGFRVVSHYDHAEPFAALYRDSIEIVVVQAKFGEILPNRTRYGAGYDAYLDPETVEGVDEFYKEWKGKGANIANPPVMILDEATSSIDTRTERLIEHGMDALMEGRTVASSTPRRPPA